MGAVEAEQSGLVARVFSKEELLEQTLQAAEKIAARSLTANIMLKETINRAYEVNLTEGLRFERRMFHSIFATSDQKEGMQAFVEKRQPNFKNQ
ncbi:putative enoyl-CoA hydratase echA8 [compost metagenome]